jgi:hypothetical protein
MMVVAAAGATEEQGDNQRRNRGTEMKRVIRLMPLALIVALSGCVHIETPFGDMGISDGSEVSVRAAAGQTVIVKIGVKEDENVQENSTCSCELVLGTCEGRNNCSDGVREASQDTEVTKEPASFGKSVESDRQDKYDGEGH